LFVSDLKAARLPGHGLHPDAGRGQVSPRSGPVPPQGTTSS